MQPRELQVAHVVEHIIVAKLRDIGAKGNIKERIVRFGGTWGTDANASTGPDVTQYFLRMPAGNSDALEAALDIMADWASAELFTDEEISRERQAVIEESRGMTADFSTLQEARRRAWFPGNDLYDYTDDAPGTLSATPASIRALHAARYVPQNMAVVVVGDIDPAQVEREIEARLGPIKAANVSPTSIALGPYSLEGGAYRTVATTDKGESAVELTFKYQEAKPGEPAGATERATALIAAPLLQDAFTNLTDDPASPILSGGFSLDFQHPARSTGLMIANARAVVRPGQTRRGLSALLNLVATIARGGFSPVRIEHARQLALQASDAGRPSSDELASRWASIYLDGHAQPSREAVRAAIASISPSEFNQKLAERFQPSNRDILLILPRADMATAPAASELPKISRQAEHARSILLERPPVKTPKLETVDFVGVAAAQGVIAGDGYTQWKLPKSNAVLFFKRSRGAKIEFAMSRRGGEARFDYPRMATASIALGVVIQSGLGGISRRAFAEFMAARRISIDPILRPGREGMLASGPTNELKTILQVARTQILKPQCRKEPLDEFKAYSAADFADGAADAAILEFDAKVDRSLVGPTKAVDRSTLRLGDLCGQYREIFGDTQNMVMVLHGDIEPDVAYRAVAASLDIQASSSVRILLRDRPLVETVAGRETSQRGANAAANVRLVMQQSFKANPRAGILVGEILNQRLLERLREVEQGTYAASAGVAVLDTPYRTALFISFDCAPASVDRMVAATKDELVKLREHGVSAEEFRVVRDRNLGRDRSPQEVAETWIAEGRLATLTLNLADVNLWIERNIDLAKLHEFVKLPEILPAHEDGGGGASKR